MQKTADAILMLNTFEKLQTDIDTNVPTSWVQSLANANFDDLDAAPKIGLPSANGKSLVH